MNEPVVRSFNSRVMGSEMGRYLLLNLGACLALVVAVPHLARDARDLAFAPGIDIDTSARPQNLVEKRKEASSRTAPRPDMLARLSSTSLPTVPLSDASKLALVELVSTTRVDARPLATALDAAESIPVTPLRPLHKPRFRGLYAELAERNTERAGRPANVASSPSSTRLAQRAGRAQKRTVMAFNRERDTSAGSIAWRNFSNTLASISP